MPDAPKTLLELFRQATELLGGQRATARYLKCNERHVRYLVAGERALTAGLLQETIDALDVHSSRCRNLGSRLAAFVPEETDG